MKYLIYLSIAAVFLILSFIELNKKQQNMKLTSSAFEYGKEIPRKYTCQGEDVNPPLEISNVPQNAKSLALIMDDPDAPIGTFVHWVVWNIDPKTTKIEENSLPIGASEGMTDFRRRGYGGPCPPKGVHRYFFKLYALSEKLDLPPNTTKKDLEKAMEGKIIAQAELMGTYQKK